MAIIHTELLSRPERTVCFTGHRPEKFPFLETDPSKEQIIRSLLREKIINAIHNGFDTFITGMARGVDTWGAFEVISLKKNMPNIKLVGMSPYRDEINRFHGQDLVNYKYIVGNVDEMHYLEEKFSMSHFDKRNQEMVDHSSLVIGAVYNMSSGTGRTIKYAIKQGLELDIIKTKEMDIFTR